MAHDRSDSSAAGRLVALIEAESASEAEQILADARERAERIRTTAAASAAAQQAAARREGETRGRRRAARRIALAEAQARTEWLCAREALIDAVIDQGRARLESGSVVSEATIDTLRHLVDEAVRALPGHSLRFRVPAACADALRRALEGHDPPLAFEGDDSVPAGGVIAETADGRLRFDNSFAARIGAIRDELRGCVASHLFADQRAGADALRLAGAESAR